MPSSASACSHMPRNCTRCVKDSRQTTEEVRGTYPQGNGSLVRTESGTVRIPHAQQPTVQAPKVSDEGRKAGRALEILVRLLDYVAPRLRRVYVLFWCQAPSSGLAASLPPGTYYRNEYGVDRQRDDFEKLLRRGAQTGCTRERPRPDEEFHFALLKLEPEHGIPTYRIVATRIAADTLSVQQGESLILLIGTVRYALHTTGPPLTTAMHDGRSIESTMYEFPLRS